MKSNPALSPALSPGEMVNRVTLRGLFGQRGGWWHIGAQNGIEDEDENEGIAPCHNH